MLWGGPGTEIKLTGTWLSRMQLTGTWLSRMQLTGTRLSRMQLAGARLAAHAGGAAPRAGRGIHRTVDGAGSGWLAGRRPAGAAKMAAQPIRHGGAAGEAG